MDSNFDPAASLQFGAGLVRRLTPAANVVAVDAGVALDVILDGLLEASFPGLATAKDHLVNGVDAFRRGAVLAASEEFRESKEVALDCLVTGLKPEDKFGIVKHVIVVEMLNFVASATAARTVQERIRCVQTTRRVCNVYVKKLVEIPEMVKWLMEKLCKQKFRSEVWLKNGLDLSLDIVPDASIDAWWTDFVKRVFIVQRQTRAFLEFVNDAFVTKGASSSDSIVAAVVGQIAVDPVVKVNVTSMTLDEVMTRLFKVTKDEEIRVWMGLDPYNEDEEEALEVE